MELDRPELAGAQAHAEGKVNFAAATWSDIAANVSGNAGGMLMPDPLAVLAALDVDGHDGLVTQTERVEATVELGGTSRGAVLIDRHGSAELGDEAYGWGKDLVIINQMNGEAVQAELMRAL